MLPNDTPSAAHAKNQSQRGVWERSCQGGMVVQQVASTATNRVVESSCLIENRGMPRFYPPARECNPATGGAWPCILSEVWTSPTQAR